MSNYQAEVEFFHSIAPKIISLVTATVGSNEVAVNKQMQGDYATEVDIAVEKLIVQEIKVQFPEDEILAEEGYSDTKITEKRTWIIDPICGTANLARDITSFCSNIALAVDEKIVAACVVDFSHNQYIWSAEDSPVYIGNEEMVKPKRPENFGALIDVDFGSVSHLSNDFSEKYTKMLNELLTIPGWMLASHNTSLSFLYTAMGKMDGFVCVFSNPWDSCASCFLVQQSGGKVTDLNGKDWQVDSQNMIAATDEKTHDILLSAVKRSVLAD